MIIPVSFNSSTILEQAATYCFERAARWKEREQNALAHDQYSRAQQFSILCNEADDCKLGIRGLLALLPGEQELLRQISELTNKLCESNSNYHELKRVVAKIQNDISGDIYLVG